MNIFMKILRWVFYALVVASIVFFALYKFSEPVNEEYFRNFLYCGFGAIGLSCIRFIMRFMY